MARIIDTTQSNITGAHIRAARLQVGLSQKQLSEQLEVLAVYVCRGSVSRIESGERTVTDMQLDAISKVLKVSLNQLFGREALS